jgi:hypothetical protein
VIIDLSSLLSDLCHHEIGRRFLASATLSQLSQVAAWIVEDEVAGLPAALALVGERLGVEGSHTFAARHIEHLLWRAPQGSLAQPPYPDGQGPGM